MSGAGCSQDCSTCSITLSACSLSPGLFLLHQNMDLGGGGGMELLMTVLPVEGEGKVELDHGLSGQITSREHLQSLDQFHHGVVVLVVTPGRCFLVPYQQYFLSRVAFLYLYVSVREQQVHDDVLGQDLRVVDA